MTKLSDDHDSKESRYRQSSGPTQMKLELRGEKKVTVLSNLPFTEDDSKRLLKGLQEFLACGGSLKDSCILLNGDMREQVIDYFETVKKELTYEPI